MSTNGCVKPLVGTFNKEYGLLRIFREISLTALPEGGEVTEQLCPHNYTAADACSLPVCAGHYGRDYAHPYTATLPDIPLELDWLLEGVFHVQVAVDMHAGHTSTQW